MYNRYIRNDKGSYTCIPEDEPSGQKSKPSNGQIGGAYNSGQPSGGQTGGAYNSGQPSGGQTGGGYNSGQPSNGQTGGGYNSGQSSNGDKSQDGFTGILRQLLDQLHLNHVDTGDLLILILIFLLKAEEADEELLTALSLLLIL